MTNRRRLENRRAIETIEFNHASGPTTQRYVASLSRFDDGALAARVTEDDSIDRRVNAEGHEKYLGLWPFSNP
jgi:hypothetical protein